MNRDVCEHFNPVDLPCDKCKPKALRLADAIDPRNEDELFWRDREAAAEELRRLHAQRDALLEALRMLVLATKEVSVGRYNEEAHDIALSKARAAIAKTEGQQ